MAIRVPLGAHEEAEAGADRRGGQVAFDDLWRHRGALHEICQRIVGDAATADDVVQETYLRALRNLDRLEQRPSLMPWLATVARRRSIDELRRRQYQRPVELTPEEPTRPEHDPCETLGVTETVAKVREALTSLTDRERDLLVKQVNQGLSLAELADFDQSSVASVRSVLARARTKLRDALADAGTRAAAPIGLLGAWMKRKVADVNARVQRVSPMLPGGYERMGEVATAAATAAVLTVGGLLPATAGGAPSDGSDATETETALVVSSRADGAGDEGGAGSIGDTVSRGTGVRSTATGTTSGGSAGGSGPDPVPGPTEGPLPGPGVPGEAPSPPPNHGTPIRPPDPPPEQPEDSVVQQVTTPIGVQGNGGTPPLFAMGEYNGECANPPCSALFRSDDGGATWKPLLATDLNAHTLMVPPNFGANESRLFAMGETGLQVSTNAGETFSAAPNSVVTGSAAMSTGFPQHDRIYIGTAPFWQYDASERQTKPLGFPGVAGPEANFAFSPDYLDDHLVMAGARVPSPDGLVAGVHACIANECTAHALAGLSEVPRVHMADAGANGIVTLAWNGRKLYRSAGAAVSFERVINIPSGGDIVALTDDGDGRLYLAYESSNPDSPNGGLAVSSDGGATWRVLSASALRHGVNSVAAVADGPIVVAVPSEAGGGVFCSADDGATWERRCR